MNRKTLAVLGALWAGFFGCAANAAQVVFTFNVDGLDNEHEIRYTIDAVEVVVSAFRAGANANVNRGATGLGVSGAPSTGEMGWSTAAGAEALLFEFASPGLTLDSVIFSAVGVNDRLSIFADTDLLIALLPADTAAVTGLPADFRSYTPSDRSAATAESRFLFRADPGPGSVTTGVRIAQVTFTTVPQAVPEPGTLAVLAVGLAGLAWRCRRSA